MDGDMPDDLEDIHTGEVNHTNLGPTNWGLYAAILALLSTLVIVGLMGAIYHRDHTSITLSHLIMACLGVLVAGLCLAVFFMTRGAYTNHKQVNHMLIGIALIAALLMFGYFLASSVYMFMYRPFHYSEMIRKHSDVNSWDKVMKKSWSFSRGWGEDRRILFWVAFFGVLAAVGFLLAAICLWLMSKFKVSTAKMCLGAACFAGLVLGCFAIDYVWTSKNYYKNYALKDLNNNLLTALLVLLIIGVVLLLLNAILNVFKQRSSHFVFGIVLIVWLFIFVCILGLILRDMRKRQFKGINNPQKCASIMDSLHRDDIKSACPNKYMTQPCTKDYLTNKWEDNSGPGFLNPGCC